MPNPDRTDFEAVWVAAAKAGFVACFEELVRRNQNTIFGFAILTTQNQQDAEEVLQETFIKAYQRLRDFRRELRFSTWLLRIAFRESLGKLQNRSSPPKVLPLSPNDDRIRRAVYRAIFGAAGLDRYALQAVPPIHIIVKNGHVTLQGVVASEADRNLAGLKANGVSGVFSVTNRLQVEKK